MVSRYNYYAIRMDNLIIIRRTLNGLKMIKSRFYNKAKELDISQVSYTGGVIMGTMPLSKWQWAGNRAIANGGYLKITRTEARGLRPYLN